MQELQTKAVLLHFRVATVIMTEHLVNTARMPPIFALTVVGGVLLNNLIFVPTTDAYTILS
jgi:hypothetical protein